MSMRVGVLGLGSAGMRHARNLKSLDCDVIGYDPSATAAPTFESEVGRRTSERAAVLAEADAIVIATPNRSHLDDLRDAIVAGKPTLVEKPLGHNAELASRLVNRARERGILVAAAHNLRFRPVARKAKQVLEGGRLGPLAWAYFRCASWLPDWRPGTDYRKGYAADPETGGVIFDAIHEFDLACHLLGPADLRSAVAARSGLLEIDSEDVADIVIGHKTGCQTAIHLDYVTRPRQRRFEVAGSDGVMTADLRSGALRLSDANGRIILDETHAFDPNDEYVAVVKDFLAAVRTGGEPSCPAREAVATLALVCKARGRAGLPQAGAARVVERQESA